MIFNTIEDYNSELEDMKTEIKETEEYLKRHPEKHGPPGNYETMKYLYNLFKNDKDNFIATVNEFKIKLKNIMKYYPQIH